MRAHLIIPSAVSTHHIQPLWMWQIPTRLESLVVILFWCLSVVLCSVNYIAYDGNL